MIEELPAEITKRIADLLEQKGIAAGNITQAFFNASLQRLEHLLTFVPPKHIPETSKDLLIFKHLAGKGSSESYQKTLCFLAPVWLLLGFYGGVETKLRNGVHCVVCILMIYHVKINDRFITNGNT